MREEEAIRFRGWKNKAIIITLSRRGNVLLPVGEKGI